MRTSLKSFTISLIGFSLLLPLSTIVFIVASIGSNLIPIQYLVLVGVLSTIITTATIIICIKSKPLAKVLSAAISLLLAIALFLGTCFIGEASSTLKDITSSGDYYDQLSVVVLKDSVIESAADLDNAIVGVQYQTQSDLIRVGVDKIQETNNIVLQIKEYSDIASQVNGLLNCEVDAILYNSTYNDLLNEQITDYQNQTRVILLCDLIFDDIDKYRVENQIQIEPSIPKDTEPTIPDITEPTIQKNDDVFAVYLSGIDVYGSISLKSRSDVNIIAIVNPSDRKVLLITTPRDYFVPIPGISGGKNDKLTHAGIYGVQASMDTLSELYDVDIDYYFRVNFTSFEKIIDALGGVDVYSEYSFSTGSCSFQKGYNHVNGAQALVFARERYSFAAGDNQRGKNQQELIKAIIKKACSPSILTAATDILNSVRSNIDTNIPEEMIQDIIRNQLEDNREWVIDTLAATGTGSYDEPYSMPGYEAYVMIPNENSVEEIKEAINKMYE